MRTELSNLNHCAVPFLSCSSVNFSCHYFIAPPESDLANNTGIHLKLDLRKVISSVIYYTLCP